MNRHKAIAWDIDGTLIDSEGLHHEALISSCAIFGVDLSDFSRDAFRGIHMEDVWAALKPRFGPSLRRETWLQTIEAYYVERAPTLAPIPGAVEVVRALARHGVAQGCVSNSARVVVDANLRALGIADFMAFSLSLDDVSAGKPDPEPYRRAAALLRLSPEEVVAVEDSATGARSARRAGLYVVGYAPYGAPFQDCDKSVTRLSDVAGLFGR